MKKTIDEIVNNLKKEGASFHKKLGVESVGFGQTQPTENGVYTPIYINLKRTVPGFVANEETGEYELGETDVIFTSDIALNALLIYSRLSILNCLYIVFLFSMIGC